MELRDLVGLVVNKEAPVAPMSVRVSDQIVDDIHHVIGAGVLFEDEFHFVHIAVDTVKFDRFHGNNATIFRRDYFAFGNACTVEAGFFVRNVFDIEAIHDP
jgi:hypothetical protein